MPLLARRKSSKKSNSQQDIVSLSSTQKTDTNCLDFQSVLAAANLSISNDGYCSPNIFESLCSLRSVIETEEMATQLILNLDEQLSTADDLTEFLKPITEIKTNENDQSYSSFNQDSVCRLLMRVQPMQNSVIQFIQKKITEHSDEEIEPDSVISLLLNQFRWLDFVPDCSSLVVHLLETLSICSQSVQKEVIGLLPELAHDNLQEMCVRELITHLQTDTSLTSAILATLENLRLTSKQFCDNQTVFTGALASVDLADLPLVVHHVTYCDKKVSFLLRVCPCEEKGGELEEVVRNVRRACDPKRWKGDVGSQLFETVISCLQQRTEIGKIYIKVLNLIRIEELIPFDVWVLAILTKESQLTYQIERIISRRMYKLPLHSTLFCDAVNGNGVALLPVFKSLVKFGEMLSKSSSLSGQELCESLYITLWNEFKHPYYQQEIISSIITLIGSSTVSYASITASATSISTAGPEVTVALSILSSLAAVSTNIDDLSKYRIFIRGVLDYADRLSVQQTDSLFSILCNLSHPHDDGDASMDELFILVRKYLSMSDTRYKHTGVVGCCVVMRFNATDEESVQNIFSFCMKSTKNYPEIRLFFYQRLTLSISNEYFPTHLVEFIKEHVASILDSVYLVDIPAENEGFHALCNGHIVPTAEYNLLGDKTTVCVCMAQRVAEPSIRQKQSAFLLPSLLRVVVTCEQMLHPDNWSKNVDAVVGCPVMTCGDVLMDDLVSNECEVVILCKLATVLWFKEIGDVYSTCEDEKIRYLISQRFAQLNRLTDEAVKLYSLHSLSFVPAGMTNFLKTTSKGGRTSVHSLLFSHSQSTLQIPPFSPHISHLLTWQNLHVVRSDDVMRCVAVDDMTYPFVSVESLLSILKDIAFWTAQLPGNPISRAKKTEQKETLLQISAAFSYSVLQALSFIYSQIYGSYISAEYDHEGVQNDETFKTTIAFPIICYIFDIFSALFESNAYRDVVYNNDVIGFMKNICYGSEVHQSSEFILRCDITPNRHTDNNMGTQSTTEYEKFYSMSQLIPLSQPFVRTVLSNVQSCTQLHVNLSSLQCMESLLFFQVDMYLRLKGDCGLIDVDDTKKRDVDVMSLCNISNDAGVSDMIDDIGLCCYDVLKRNGMNGKKSTAQTGICIKSLIRMCVVYATDPIIRLKELVEAVSRCNDMIYEEKEVEDVDIVRDGSLQFATLNTANFRFYFTAVTEELLRIIENANLEKIEESDDSNCKEKLEMLKRQFALLEVLVSVTKKNDKQTVLVTTIKGFGQFMSFFLGPCMTWLRKLLVRFPNDVVFLIKLVQRSTRQIQSLCAHGKVTKDSSIMVHVPRIKKQLEQLIYQMRVTLKQMGAEDAFWLGNLKNRYLNGQAVSEEGDVELSEKRTIKRKRGGEKEGNRKRVKGKEDTIKEEEEKMEEEGREEETENEKEEDNMEGEEDRRGEDTEEVTDE